jgi:hypothetical protein
MTTGRLDQLARRTSADWWLGPAAKYADFLGRFRLKFF